VRRSHFDALAPVCPSCLHGRGVAAPLTIAQILSERNGHIAEAILHCSDPECWLEFPVIDGVPVLVANPRDYLARTGELILMRQDLPPTLTSLMGDSLGPGSTYDTARQHLSLYAGDHYCDWSGGEGAPQVAATLERGLECAGGVEGPMLDLGCSVGRGVWALAAAADGPVLGGDLNFAMLRLAQRLLIEGEARFERRRVGIAYDPVTIRVPEGADSSRVDFWAIDAAALPFPPGHFRTVTAINLVDCVPAPAQTLAEIARVLAAGGKSVMTTPYDWSTAATAIEGWIGGHSQRTAPEGHGGASEPALRSVLASVGLEILGELDDLPWRLEIHDRSVMHYRLHLLALRRT